MNSPQLTLWDEPDDILRRFDGRLRQVRPGMLLWTGALRSCWRELTAQREQALTQLDLAAYEVEQGRDRGLILERLARARNLLGGTCLLALLAVVVLGSPDLRRPARAARVLRPRWEVVS